MRRLFALVGVFILAGLPVDAVYSQDEQKASDVALSVPSEVPLGKWVKVTISGNIQKEHIVRVLQITSGRDRDVTILDNELTIVPIGPNTYAYSAPLVGEFVVELISTDQNRPFIKDALFKVVMVPLPPNPGPEPGPPGPEPNPNPPGPSPAPTPDPDTKDIAPFPSPEGLRVLILEESSERANLASGQQEVLLSWEVRQWLTTNTVRESNSAGYRIWDDDYTDAQLGFVAEAWRKAYDVAKKESNGKLPWIVIANKNKGYSGPLPETTKEFMELVNKFK